MVLTNEEARGTTAYGSYPVAGSFKLGIGTLISHTIYTDSIPVDVSEEMVESALDFRVFYFLLQDAVNTIPLCIHWPHFWCK